MLFYNKTMKKQADQSYENMQIFHIIPTTNKFFVPSWIHLYFSIKFRKRAKTAHNTDANMIPVNIVFCSLDKRD